MGVAKDGADKVAAAKFYGGMGAAHERTKTQRTKQAELAKRSSQAELPSRSFLEWRHTQVDDGEFLTESLAEVTSQQEEAQQAEDTTTADVIQQGGNAVIQMRKNHIEVTDASDDRAAPTPVRAAGRALEYGVRQVPEQSLGASSETTWTGSSATKWLN